MIKSHQVLGFSTRKFQEYAIANAHSSTTVEYQTKHQYRFSAHSELPKKSFTLHSSNTLLNYMLTHLQKQPQLYLSDQCPTQSTVTLQITYYPCDTVLFLNLVTIAYKSLTEISSTCFELQHRERDKHAHVSHREAQSAIQHPISRKKNYTFQDSC